VKGLAQVTQLNKSDNKTHYAVGYLLQTHFYMLLIERSLFMTYVSEHQNFLDAPKNPDAGCFPEVLKEQGADGLRVCIFTNSHR
jgi:hypothetical protein